MPIIANCPSCGKALSVADQYAGQKGKCPFCGTIFTFPSAAPAMPPSPPPVVPLAQEPPPMSPSWSGGPPVMAPSPRVPGTGLDMLSLILLSVGLFFVFFFFIMCFLNWTVVKNAPPEIPGLKGMHSGLVVFLFMFDLLLLLGAGTGFVLALIPNTSWIGKIILRYAVAFGAFLGTLAVLSTLSAIISPVGIDYPPGVPAGRVRQTFSVGAGAWLGFISALVICGVFVFQTLRWPVELPAPQPFVRRWLVFTVSVGLAGLIGLIIFIVRIV